MSAAKLRLLPDGAPSPIGDLPIQILALERYIRNEDAAALASTTAALKHRHASGTLMLALRNGGKRLPNGVQADLVKHLAISPTEIKNRMKLAAKYQVGELANALASYESWLGICQHGLYTKAKPTLPRALPSAPKPIPIATSARAWGKTLMARSTTRPLSASDKKALRALAQIIAELLAAADEVQ